MITVKGFKANRQIYKFVITEHGEEIVCSAVSALSINLVNSLQILAKEKVSYQVDDGVLIIDLPDIKDGKINEKATLLIDAYVLGIQSIEDEYPKEITFKIVN